MLLMDKYTEIGVVQLLSRIGLLAKILSRNTKEMLTLEYTASLSG